jgi:molecular chaperone DnaK
MYKKASAETGPGPGTGAQGSEGNGSAKTDEKVVDAEFTEVDKDKK